VKRVLAFFIGRWFLSFVGAAALAVIVWLLGPLLALLEGVVARLVAIAAIFLVWLLANLAISLIARRRQKKMVAQLTEATPDPESVARQAASEEIGLLRERLEAALLQLRRASRGKQRGSGYLYELPWYMLIGPPGSGKTTSLRNSGLAFVSTDRSGRDSIRGVGGTRNCDWWLAEEAVLLDTAGRYTTQDSDQAVDQKAWLGFLDLLKNFRPRQPINGAIVAIGLPDLVAMGPDEREAHARAIRARLKELHERFGARFPVYVALTKLDLVAGFVEFFDDLDRQAREQVWGMTFPLEADGAQLGAIAEFDAQFDRLIGRLNARLLARVSEDRDIERRALIFGFPQQLASLKAPLGEFLNAIFAPSRFEERPLLRGVYFVSATQQGTPVDRLMAAIAQRFSIERQRLPAFSGTGRGYFLTRLFKGLIFEEASLVRADPKSERRRLWRQRAAHGGVIAVALALLLLWSWSYFGNRALVDRVGVAAQQYAAMVRPLDKRIVDDDDVASILPALDAARALPTGYDDQQHGAPLGLTFGLYQGRKLGSEATLAYRRALNGLLLPRLMVGVHNKLAASLDNPELANLLLEVYLMLGQQGPLNRDLVKSAVAAIWDGRAAPGMDPAAARMALAAHVDALLEDSLAPIPLDDRLVAQARAVVARVPLAERAYRQIVDGPQAKALAVWRVIDHTGPAANQVLTRGSGKTLADGVPGLYTRDGFYKVVLVQAPLAVKAVAEETWVLGPQYTVSLTSARYPALVNEVVDLYLKDYIRQWDALLADIKIVHFADLPATIDAINTLSGPASPLKQLLVAAAKETTLVEPSKPPAAGAGAAGALNTLAAGAGAALGNAPPGKAVDDHFKPLHDLVAGAATGQSPLDDVMKRLDGLYTALSSEASNPGLALQGQRAPGAASAAAAASQLAQVAARLPPPLNGMVASIAASSSGISTGGTRKAINDLYLSTVLPLCRQVLNGRYPIDRASKIDVSLGDFATLFKPGGLIDRFFTTNLKPYVDVTRSPWRNQKVENVDLGLSADTLAQFERAHAIRDAFFPAGGQMPAAPFVVEPKDLSPKALQVVLDLDGQTLTYAHGPTIPASMAWPSPSGAKEARITFSALSGGGTPSLSAEGPWAWFRLLDQATIEGALADQFTATFKVGDLSASFKIRAASVRNPFRGADLARFHCPDSL
jgi:type VI secretion system protein ImpL